MSGAKEIRTKIASIKSTQKITKAMQMVAASKMRRAQERMQATRPYAEKIQNVISHLAHAHPEYHHPFLAEREVRRVGVIIVSTDRGLCGGLNINLFKQVIAADEALAHRRRRDRPDADRQQEQRLFQAPRRERGRNRGRSG